jgi:hypothetical protein
VPRTEVSEDLEEAREPAEIQRVTVRGVLLRREHGRVQPMGALIGKPVVVPLFAPILLLQGEQSLGLEKLHELQD